MFWKKEKKTIVIDRVFISTSAKENAIVDLANQPGKLLIICWFESSYDQINAITKNTNAEVMLARETQPHHIKDSKVLFFEHHPILKKDDELLQKLQLKEAVFYSALDEPLFKYFGGEKIIHLPGQMGMQANEAIEHKLISASIQNAQEKIENKVPVEISATSQEEWFEKNLRT